MARTGIEQAAEVRTALNLIVWVLFSLSVGACQSPTSAGRSDAARGSATKAAPAVVAVFEMKRPGVILRRILTLAAQADPRLSVVSADVFANAVQAGLTLRYPDLGAIDLQRPVRVFFVGGSDGNLEAVGAVPVVSAAAAEKLMDRFLRKRPTAGPLRSHAWQDTVLFWIVRKEFLLFSTSRAVLGRLSRSLAEAAGQGEPERDFQLKTWPGRLFAMWGLDYRRALGDAADFLRMVLGGPRSASSSRRPSPSGPTGVLPRLMEAVTHYAADIDSVGLHLDLLPTAVSFGFNSSAVKGTALERLLQACRPGQLPGLDLIPPGVYFLFSVRINPADLSRRLQPVLVESGQRAGEQPVWVRVLAEVLRNLPSGLTVALHGGGGPKDPKRPALQATAVAEGVDGPALRRAARFVFRALAALGVRKKSKPAPFGGFAADVLTSGMAFQSGRRQIGGVEVDWIRVSTGDGMRLPSWARSALGLDSRHAAYELAVAVSKGRAMATAGRSALVRMERMLTPVPVAAPAPGRRPEPTPGPKPATAGLAMALPAAPRCGWIGLSILDLIKETRLFGAKGTEAWVKIAEKIPSHGGIVLSWGVDSGRREAHLGVAWPIRHFIALSRYFGGGPTARGAKGLAVSKARPRPGPEDESDL